MSNTARRTIIQIFMVLIGYMFGVVYQAHATQRTILNAALNGGSYPWDTARADLNNNFDDCYVLVNNITVTAPVNLNTMDSLIDANVLQISEFVTLSGRPAHSTDLGAFTGTTIPDGSNNKEAFQALETAVEGKENTGVAQGLLTTHETAHPIPTTRDARNQIAGNYADGTANTGDQVGDGVTITGAGTPGDPFVSVGGSGTIVADTTDPTKAAKAVEAEELVSSKVSGQPGYSFWFEAETTNELFTGFQGPADLSVNISHVMPSSAGTVGQVFEIDTVQIGQTLPNGETGTLVTLKNGDKGSGTFSFDTYPTYEDSPHTSGIAVNSTTLAVYSVDASKWLTVGLTDTLDPAPTLYTLTITDPGNNDYIQSTDGFINCGNSATDCTYDYTSGAAPELTATAASGRQFDNWAGDATDTSTATNPDTITMNAAKTLTATFSTGASVEILRPDGDIVTTSWTFSDTGFYQDISDENNATYITTSTQNIAALFSLANTSASSGKTINSVTLHIIARDTVGSTVPSIRISTDSSAYTYPTSEITGSFVEYTEVLTVNPKTGLAWTTAGAAGIDSLFEGSVSANTTTTIDVAELWVEVDYVP